ncbi:ribose-phosphate diphosphokinase [Candidatus Woesearchaeota archaeon]|nr:ribose-phosphate diphosphokinase [Candidatus Woesearchaeota archaeon]
MLIIGCSHGSHLAKKIANKLKKPYSALKVKKFPDNELNIRLTANIKGKIVVLVQSFYGNISDCIIESVFAAETAKELGAKKVFLVAPYFPYMRQDRRFKPGQVISNKIMDKLISRYFDKAYIIDPHLHRETQLSHLFSIPAKKLSANPYIADYIKKSIKNPLIVGPDWESYKWARKVAEKIGCDNLILEKKRYSGRKVKVSLNKKIEINNKNIVFVDDMISTGNTIIEAAKKIKKLGAKKFYCIAVHGIFVENALKKLRKANIKVTTTNTIPNKAAKIDVSGLIAEVLKKWKKKRL